MVVDYDVRGLEVVQAAYRYHARFAGARADN
jgi:hypothetical protein